MFVIGSMLHNNMVYDIFIIFFYICIFLTLNGFQNKKLDEKTQMVFKKCTMVSMYATRSW